jgi:MbtH protein
VTNPFDQSDGLLVLVNDVEQYSLWPDFAPIPDGWTVVHGSTDREDALRYVEKHWPDPTRWRHG